MKQKCEVEFQVIECASCGVMFGITNRLFQVRSTKNPIYCTNGHANFFSDKSPYQSLHERYEELQNNMTNLQKVNAKLNDRIEELEVEKSEGITSAETIQ